MSFQVESLSRPQQTEAKKDDVSMGKYFKPPRRKIGVVTLVISLALTVCWLRSVSTIDSFQSDIFNSLTFIESSLGLIHIRRVTSVSTENRREPIPVDALSAIVTDLNARLSPSVNYVDVHVESNRVVMKLFRTRISSGLGPIGNVGISDEERNAPQLDELFCRSQFGYLQVCKQTLRDCCSPAVHACNRSTACGTKPLSRFQTENPRLWCAS